MMDNQHSSGSVEGNVRLILRAEGAAVLAAAVSCYIVTGGSWILFLVLFLVPDISFLAYRFGSRIGAIAYNAMHFYAVPILLGLIAHWTKSSILMSIALIWVCHIAFDRMLGYGLKYPSAFTDTHLGMIGRNQPQPPSSPSK